MSFESPHVSYGDACFERVCPKCGRFVKPDDKARPIPNSKEANATCSKCGRVIMNFEGYY
jgi:RNase P subunit RPR2